MTKYIDDYANTVLNYGGIPTRRIDIIKDLREKGFEQKRIDFYLFCLDQNKGGWHERKNMPQVRNEDGAKV